LQGLVKGIYAESKFIQQLTSHLLKVSLTTIISRALVGITLVRADVWIHLSNCLPGYTNLKMISKEKSLKRYLWKNRN